MTMRFQLVAGDTRAEVQAQLSQYGRVMDVSAAAVRMKFKSADDDVILADIEGILLPGTVQEDGRTADVSQYPVAGSGGRVKFQFPAGSLNVPLGFYEGELSVIFPGGPLDTVFDKLRFIVRASL